MKTLIILCFLVTVAAIGLSTAEMPKTMSYQGVLKNADGTVVGDGEYDVTFALYDVETGGDTLWTESQTVSVEGGIFHTILGQANLLDLGFDVQCWLGVDVESQGELTPRVKLAASPYAFRAQYADVADDGDWLVSGDDIYRQTGGVGIWTSSPLTRFHVNAAGVTFDRYALFQTSSGTGYGGGLLLTNSTVPQGTSFKMTSSYNFAGNGIARFGFVDNDDTETFIPGPAMELDYASGNLLLAQSGGRVGIGTATADYRLDVDGEIRATGAIHGTADNAVNATNADNAVNADKVDGNHIVVARVFTASGTQYLVNTSYARIYADGTSYSLKIHNPGGSGFQYYYSIDHSSPVWATLSAGGTVTISGINTNAIDIRIMAAGNYVSFSGIGGGNGWISGQAFYQ